MAKPLHTPKQRGQHVRVLQTIIETVNSSSSVPQTLERIIELVCELTKADACFLYLLEPSLEKMVLYASKPAHPESIGTLALEVGEGVTGWVAQQRQAVVIEERAFEDERFKVFRHLPEDRFQALLSVPIVSGERLMAVMNVQHRSVHRYSPNAVALLEMIGRLVGGAIANARLNETAQRSRRELDTLARVSEAVASEQYLDEILQRIVSVTAELMGSKICSLMLLNEQKGVLEIKATQSLSKAYRHKPPIRLGEGISGRVVQERRAITVADVTRDSRFQYADIAKREGLRSLASVPMMIRERVIGVLHCYTASLHSFSDIEIQLLSTVANQAAVAVENARLIEDAAALQKTLQDRKVVERAKGVLMQEYRLSEEEAFRRLQRQSMEHRKTMREIAEALLIARQLRTSSQSAYLLCLEPTLRKP